VEEAVEYKTQERAVAMLSYLKEKASQWGEKKKKRTELNAKVLTNERDSKILRSSQSLISSCLVFPRWWLIFVELMSQKIQYFL
jgi:hypothetical protein